jgi:hypothetical protein
LNQFDEKTHNDTDIEYTDLQSQVYSIKVYLQLVVVPTVEYPDGFQ